jgi:hypothetical protein
VQSLNENIISFQEQSSVPSIAWKITLTKGASIYDVSERFRGGNPGIIDSADYRENYSYVNEVVLPLRNDDGYITNAAKTGILDVADGTQIEVKIYGYFNIPNGNIYPLLKFGGWVDLKRIKPNYTKGICNITSYSYLGLGDFLKSANITTQYIDSNGLILWKTGLWLKNAAITNYILLNGIHMIETRISGAQKQARLDDGDWVNIADNPAGDYTLKNHFDTERVTIYYYSSYIFQEGTSYLIVKTEGQQYCETFFYYPEISNILIKAFAELGITSTYIERYDIETYDGRKVPSLLKYVISSMTNSAISIVSDGVYRIYISLVTADSPNKNQIWYYNFQTDILTKIYETIENTYTQHRLILDTTANKLIAWYDNKPEDEDKGLIQVFDLSYPIPPYITILFDPLLENANAYIRFHYLKANTQILIVKSDGIYGLDITGLGGVVKVINEANIETYGLSFMWEKPGGNYYFYFTKNVGGSRQIWRAQWNGSWMAAAYVKDFHDQGDYNNYFTFPFYAEDKIITLHNQTGIRYFKITDNSEGAIANSSGYQVNSFFEQDSKMYFFAQLPDETDKRIGSISSNAITIETDNLNTNAFFKISTNWTSTTQVQKICIFKNLLNEYDLAFISNRPAFLMRFSKYVTPFIYDEYDYASKTIRELLQEIANNYLGYIKISAQKTGYFVSRDTYSSEDTIVIKPEYIKSRAIERVYNEVYEAVVVKTSNIEAYRGNRAVDAKILDITLNLIADELAYDMAQFFLDYYSEKRILKTINYLPTFYNYDSLDGADLTALDLTTGKIHKLAIKKETLEIGVLYKENS